MDAIPIQRIPAAEQTARTAVARLLPGVRERCLRGAPESAADSATVKKILTDALVLHET